LWLGHSSLQKFNFWEKLNFWGEQGKKFNFSQKLNFWRLL
jgi:hypothetical protein